MINFQGHSRKEVKHAPINGNALNLTVVQANGDAAKKIVIISMFLKSSGTGALIFKSDNTALKYWTPSANESLLPLGDNPNGWFQTESGESFKIGNASQDTLTGGVSYIEY